MATLYTWCAALGATFLFGQFLLGLLGVGGDDGDGNDIDLGPGGESADAGGDHPHFDHSDQWFVGMLSFRAVVAALTVFGLVGLGMHHQFHAGRPGMSLLIAGAAGFGMLYAVAWLLRAVHKLRADGTVKIERAIGLPGNVYLTIPANQSGRGKVIVKLQDRTMEYAATTSGPEIPTGSAVVVLGVPSPGVVDVAKAESVIGASS